MSNKISKPPIETASKRQNLCLRCWGTNSNGYQLVMATLVDSVPDAIKEAKEHWKKVAHRYQFLNYKIFLGNAEIKNGRLGANYHHQTADNV